MTEPVTEEPKLTYRIDSMTFGGVQQQITVLDENGQWVRNETRDIPATTLNYNNTKEMARIMTPEVEEEYLRQKARLDAVEEVDTAKVEQIVKADNEALAIKKAVKS